MTQPKNTPQHPQEKNLRERSNLDNENVPDPISFDGDYSEAGRLIEDEDLDRIERDQPKTDDIDDIKHSKQA